VRPAVAGEARHPHGVQFDGDPAFSLEIHGVQQLLAHEALFHRAGGFDQPVGQGGFAMIYVGDDAEVTDSVLRHAENITGGRTVRR